MKVDQDLANKCLSMLNSGFNCAEVVIDILGDDIKYEKVPTLKIAAAIGAGLARWGTVCGAVLGGAMALGYSFGPEKCSEKEKRENTYLYVQKLLKDFEDVYKTIQCRQLIGFNLLDPEERQKYRQSPLRKDCSEYIAFVVSNVKNTLSLPK